MATLMIAGLVVGCGDGGNAALEADPVEHSSAATEDWPTETEEPPTEAEDWPTETGESPTEAEESRTSDAPAHTSEPAISYSWTDEEGYSFALSVFEPTITTTSNTIDQAPGEALITATISGDVELRNTTPDRNAWPASQVGLRPVFASDSPICVADVGMTLDYSAPGLMSHDPETAYCYLYGPSDMINFADLADPSIGPDGPSIAPDGVYLGVYLGSLGIGEYFTDIVIPEEDLSTALADLEEPAFWTLNRGGVTTEVESVEQHRCSGVVVATSAGGFDVCEQDVQ